VVCAGSGAGQSTAIPKMHSADANRFIGLPLQHQGYYSHSYRTGNLDRSLMA
jgi:hypothetical protein